MDHIEKPHANNHHEFQAKSFYPTCVFYAFPYASKLVQAVQLHAISSLDRKRVHCTRNFADSIQLSRVETCNHTVNHLYSQCIT